MRLVVAFLALFLAFPAFAGEVTMRKEGGAWVVRNESGGKISPTDQCQGLTDAITYVTTNGHDLRVIGGQITSAGQDVSVIQCDQTVNFPPMQGARIYFGSVTVNFPPSVAGDGFVFDSCMMCSVDFHGQIVFWGGGNPLVLAPRNLLPLDDFVGPIIVDSSFRIMTVVQLGSGPTAVDIRGDTVVNNEFQFIELNSESWHGLRVQPGKFTGNKISARHIHENLGMGVINAPGLGYGNVWDIVTGGAQGFYTTASSDQISLTVEGAPNPALTLEPGACDNLIFRRTLNGPVIDNSGCANRRF